MSRSYSTDAIVLKRANVGEADRVVTLLSRSEGKLTCVAKGVRKLSSSQRAALEPGNLVTVHLVKTKSLPILTQTKLQADFAQAKQDLKGMKRLLGVLEFVDQLFPEGEEDAELFAGVVSLMAKLSTTEFSLTDLQASLGDMLVNLGYQHPADTKYASITEYVTAVAERPMRSFHFLTPSSSA